MNCLNSFISENEAAARAVAGAGVKARDTTGIVAGVRARDTTRIVVEVPLPSVETTPASSSLPTGGGF